MEIIERWASWGATDDSNDVCVRVGERERMREEIERTRERYDKVSRETEHEKIQRREKREREKDRKTELIK